jgi:uncharacterized protein YbjT (DUF2867 family)
VELSDRRGALAPGPLRAIVIGATGAVGSALVRELLASSHWASVTTVGRRVSDDFTAAPGATRLAQHRIDLDRIEGEVAELARGCDAAFCTLGVGQPRKFAKEEVWKVDVGYAGAFARACKAAGVRHASLLASVGADPKSSSHYLRVKGAAEEAFRTCGFARTSLFRPSLLVTRNIRYGLQDRVTQLGFPLISWALPRRLHQIRVEDLGRAMRINAERPAPDGIEVVYYPDCVRILESASRDRPS